MSETITVTGGEPVTDWDGNIVTPVESRDIPGCMVQPVGGSKVDSDDVTAGDTTRLQVFAPPGTIIAEGEEVTWRGIPYRVAHVPFDWAVGRIPWNPWHVPRVEFILERKEA